LGRGKRYWKLPPRIMATKGFSGASISMICKAAGCPASSLYWHFSSKENLFARGGSLEGGLLLRPVPGE
jgi:hypothetical protein